MSSSRHRRRPTEPQSPDARRAGESARAFAAFVAYCELGPGRSLEQAARAIGKSIAMVKRWSAAHAWVERAGRWDDRLADLEAAALRRIAEEKARVWAEREEALRERRWEVAERMLEKAERMLKAPLHEQSAQVDIACGACGWYGRDEAGEVDICPTCGGIDIARNTVVIVTPARWTLNTARLLFATACELARGAIADDRLTAEAPEDGAVYEFRNEFLRLDR